MKKEHVCLSAADRAYLQGLLAKGSLTVKTFKRATALLEVDRGRSFSAIAESWAFACRVSLSGGKPTRKKA